MMGMQGAAWLMAASILTLSHGANAANWLELFGNEPPEAPLFRPLALLQPTYTYIDADPISGLQGPLASNNGKHIFNNQVLPDFEGHEQFQFLRARFGGRGRLTGKINYTAFIEAGKNPMTVQQDVMLSSLSLTFNHLPGARVRAGLFKLPTDEEAMLAVGLAYPYTYFSSVVQNLLIEQPVRFVSSMPGNASLANAEAASGCNCFHDWGVQLYDWFNRGDWEFSYAAMISNGSEIENLVDTDSNKDLTLHLRAAYVFGGKGPNRQDLSAYIWRQAGEREFNHTDHDRIREGLGVKLSRGSYRAAAAYLRGDGMIASGYNPLFSGSPIAVGVDEKADGWYLEGGWRFHPRWELDLRHDVFNLMTENAINTRELTSTTLGLQHFLRKDTRISLNYEWRDMVVSNPSAIPATGFQRSNAQAVADNLGDRISLQLTWYY